MPMALIVLQANLHAILGEILFACNQPAAGTGPRAQSKPLQLPDKPCGKLPTRKPSCSFKWLNRDLQEYSS
ncbi:hypothetical protein EDD22DRAFT_875442 [Suillus occidentalis]|nr:hypothetical protein EDD22DRAFT_875442 [Suillus occidentalis]